MHEFNKLFNIGLNKSGTTSLSEALNLLGIRTIHYKFQNQRVSDVINTNIDNNNKPLTGLEYYTGFSDFRGKSFYKLLDKEYPNSKFIITTRPLKEWIKSRVAHVKRNLVNKSYKYEFTKIDEKKWIKERDLFFQEVNAYFKNSPNKLLIIDITSGDGWDKLCPFLNMPVPNIDFPKKNIKR